jgi:hypothetical protein
MQVAMNPSPNAIDSAPFSLSAASPHTTLTTESGRGRLALRRIWVPGARNARSHETRAAKRRRGKLKTVFVPGADEDGETCTRVCLTGGRELLHNGAREEDSKATVDGQEGKRKNCARWTWSCLIARMKKSLAPRQREMVPLISAAWDGVDCIMYLVGYGINYSR